MKINQDDFASFPQDSVDTFPPTLEVGDPADRAVARVHHVESVGMRWVFEKVENVISNELDSGLGTDEVCCIQLCSKVVGELNGGVRNVNSNHPPRRSTVTSDGDGVLAVVALQVKDCFSREVAEQLKVFFKEVVPIVLDIILDEVRFMGPVAFGRSVPRRAVCFMVFNGVHLE